MLKRTHGYLKAAADKIYGYKYHMQSKMFHAVELHKAKARYVRIKVPSYCSNTDVITNIHVTVNELNTEGMYNCCRFCKAIRLMMNQLTLHKRNNIENKVWNRRAKQLC